MVKIENKQIIIDGKPVIIMCAQLHYFRNQVHEWQDRISKVIEAGCNAIAIYIPWLCHQEEEGVLDLIGRTRDELNLGRFLDLCQENGLYVFLRPGPFVMSEMKNEGIPYWLMEKHPEIIPTTWDNRVTPNPTLDYLAPNFIKEVDKWYQSVMEIARPRLQTNGGSIIAIQLDNEVGMLTWVSNSPDLTDFVIHHFIDWLKNNYNDNTLCSRYPFDFNDFNQVKMKIKSPTEDYATYLRTDLGYYYRFRTALYIKTLREICEKYGVKDIPFVVNIHGFSGGRAHRYPIGISQLYESYQEDGFISGSDIYMGDITVENFHDLYIVNTLMDAVHSEHQPLTSAEFNCGDGNYGDNLGSRTDVSAIDFKTRICIAQGNRLLNYYTFAGGKNYRLKNKPQDGNDRIASPGERHGFAAPVDPEGELNYTYERMSRVIKTVNANVSKLASMYEERDNVSYGFIPDYFMTEYHYPKSDSMKEIQRNLEQNRVSGAWNIILKSMLLSNYRFNAVDIQNKSIDVTHSPIITFASAKYMSATIQQKLVNYLHKGGNLLLYGELPTHDLEGNECIILANALQVKVKETIYNKPHFYMSTIGENYASSRPEVRTYYAQTFESNSILPILRLVHNKEVCGFESSVEEGKAIVIACEINCDIKFVNTMLTRLGAKKALSHNYIHHGLFMTTTINHKKERFLHLINLDGLDKEFQVFENNYPLFEGRTIHLFNKDAAMLPMNVTYHNITINYSTAEVIDVNNDFITLRLTQPEDIISLNTSRDIISSKDYRVVRENTHTLIMSNKHAKVDNKLTVWFK